MPPEDELLRLIRPDLADKVRAPRSLVVRQSGWWACGFIATGLLALGLTPMERTIEAPMTVVPSGAGLAVIVPAQGEIGLLAASGASLPAGGTIAVLGERRDLEAVAAAEDYARDIRARLAATDAVAPLPPAPGGLRLLAVQADVLRLSEAATEWNSYIEEEPDALSAADQGRRLELAAARRREIEGRVPVARDLIRLAERKIESRAALVERGFASRASLLDLERDALNARLAASQQAEALAQVDSEIAQLRAGGSRDTARRGARIAKLRSDVVSAAEGLASSLRNWRSTHVVTAPVAGRFEVFERREVSDRVEAGQELGVLVTPAGGVRARAYIAAYGASAIRQGQEVRVRLDAYPARENGHLTAVVRSKSAYLQNGSYYVEAEFRAPQRTSRGVSVQITPGMPGMVEIVTARRSLLHDLFRAGVGLQSQ